jgi:hypothetical protein
MNQIDRTPRYAPTSVIIARKMKLFPVLQAIVYAPGTAPKEAPIMSEYTVLELRTEAGSRWYGFERAYINSELRMVVAGFPTYDEVRANWPIVPEEMR